MLQCRGFTCKEHSLHLKIYMKIEYTKDSSEFLKSDNLNARCNRAPNLICIRSQTNYSVFAYFVSCSMMSFFSAVYALHSHPTYHLLSLFRSNQLDPIDLNQQTPIYTQYSWMKVFVPLVQRNYFNASQNR